MSISLLNWADLLILYVVGYFIWLGYALNQFINEHEDFGRAHLIQIFMAFIWPGFLAGYVSYQIWRRLGIRYRHR